VLPYLRIGARTIALVLVIFLSACATGIAPEAPVSGLPIYGTYCGPGHPATPADIAAIDNGDERNLATVAFLENQLTPLDFIDAACRDHDVCYVKTWMQNPACDTQFLVKLAPIIARGPPVCRLLAMSLVGPFYLKARQHIENSRDPSTQRQLNDLQIYASLGFGTAFMSSGFGFELVLSGGLDNFDYCRDVGDGSKTLYIAASNDSDFRRFVTADQRAPFRQLARLQSQHLMAPNYFGQIAFDRSDWTNINQDVRPTPIVRTVDPSISARLTDGSITVGVKQTRARRLTDSARGLPEIALLSGDASIALRSALSFEELKSARLSISDALRVGSAQFARSVAWLPASSEIVYAVATHLQQPGPGAVPLVTTIVFRGKAVDFERNIESVRGVLATLNVPGDARNAWR